MNKISVDLENCYGMKKLQETFDFTQKGTYSIYAANGIMKTSFAKTFKDLSDSSDSKDSIFKSRTTKRVIADENGTPLTNNQVFVIVPYDKEFKSNKITTLLVNKALREQYDEIHSKIDEKKESLIKELKSLSGLKANIVAETFSTDITYSPKEKDFYVAIKRLKEEVLDKSDPELEGIVYQKIFNETAIAFLTTKDFKAKLKNYIDKYNELIQKSTYFKKGVFNHNNASTIAKNLKDNGFFKAKHSVRLSGATKDVIITSEAELEEVIQKEKENILNNLELKIAFDEIDLAINRNVGLREFREYLENNQALLPELENLDRLKQRLWISYLKKNIEAYKALESEYADGKNKIDAIIEQAKRERTDWISVIEEFNTRFFVPFTLSIDNQEDVILNSDAPNVKFIFKDFEENMPIDEGELFKVLSNGELRALYILNIIFEVEARRQSAQETLFVIDDIADSFDYKNKYAIIEYLKDISQEGIFKQIILTHNFDFHRTVSSRLELNREQRLNTIKTKDGIRLTQEKYQNNPFVTWKKELHRKDEMLIASIPFFRNLAEYSGDQANFLKLTSMLHFKPDTAALDLADLEATIKDIAKDKNDLVLSNNGRKVIDLIYELADKILLDPNEIIELENKIVLAMGIRLKAEEFMVAKINDSQFWQDITSIQTRVLINRFADDFPNEVETIALLQRVNLMTPENIHLNSFMYEPILDMANDHLKSLYSSIINMLE